MKITASQFVNLLTIDRGIRARGILEHYAHSDAVLRYQSKQDNDRSVYLPDHQNASKNAILWFAVEKMPSELVNAYITLSEYEINCEFGNHLLIGRVDQLYQINKNYLLVDTKSHVSATFSDQLQLSFYAYILRCKNYALLDYAYIRSARETVKYNSVEIIPHLAVLELLEQAVQLM